MITNDPTLAETEGLDTWGQTKVSPSIPAIATLSQMYLFVPYIYIRVLLCVFAYLAGLRHFFIATGGNWLSVYNAPEACSMVLVLSQQIKLKRDSKIKVKH